MTGNASRPLSWVQMPTNWVRFERGLDRFSVARLGNSVTALKLYLGITAAHAQSTLPGLEREGISLSYVDLTRLTGAARGMIGPSLELLDGLISIRQGKGRRTNEYLLEGFPARGGWGKLPAAHLLKSGALLQFEPRARSDLAALKLYILLVAVRDSRRGLAEISYTRATEYMSTTRDYVSKGISKLIEADLVVVRTAHQVGLVDSFAAQRNIYYLRGLDRSGRQSSSPGSPDLDDLLS